MRKLTKNRVFTRILALILSINMLMGGTVAPAWADIPMPSRPISHPCSTLTN